MEKINEILNIPLITLGTSTFTLGQLLWVPIVLGMGVLFIQLSARFLRGHLGRRKVKPDVIHLLVRAYWVIALAVLLFSGLAMLNVPLAAFAFVSGAVAIGFGFGAQNIINNFISGWILMWERPIRIGDFLEIGDTRGTVEAINTRSTRIRRIDGVHLLIPNSYLLENTVVNWTLVDRLVRTSVMVGVAYGSPVRRVSELMARAAAEHPGILADPAPLVLFSDFGDSALVFEIYFWINASVERDMRVIRSDLRYRIDELFRESDVTIAFPQRDVHIDGSLTLGRRQPAAD